MTREYQLTYLVAALLAAWPSFANAATIVETTSGTIDLSTPFNPPNSSRSQTFSFPDIVNANELLSVSGGSVIMGEGGTLSVDVDYAGGTSAQIYKQTCGYACYFDFANQIGNASFTPGTIDGLTFNVTSYLGAQGSLPSGTSFTFAYTPSVPEPATWAMMLTGMAGIGLALRRRRKPLATVI